MKYTIKLGRLMSVDTAVALYGSPLEPYRIVTIFRCTEAYATPGTHTNRTYTRVTTSTWNRLRRVQDALVK